MTAWRVSGLLPGAVVNEQFARYRESFSTPARLMRTELSMAGGLVISGGRVVDPASGMDAVAEVALLDGRIAAVGTGLGGAERVIDAAFVAAQSWTLVAEFSDVASGKDDRRSGFQAALARCRQLGAVLAAARLDRITRRAHTLSQLLEDGYSVRAADMPGADDLMMRVYAAMAQKERERRVWRRVTWSSASPP